MSVLMCTGILFGLVCGSAAMAVVVDRIAVTVGNDAITESEVLEDVRVTAFLNSEPLNLSPEARRAAAERLVDQYFIRHEMNLGRYPDTEKHAAEQMLENFKKSHFKTAAEFQQALKTYGIAAEQVKAHLQWDLAALRFTDLQFQGGVTPTSETFRRPLEWHEATRSHKEVQNQPENGNSHSRAHANPQPAQANHAPPRTATFDQQLDAWLQEVRVQTRIEFKKEAFE